MAKRKRKGGRRRAKPGLAELTFYGAAISEVMAGGPFKNAATDSLRNMPLIDQLPRGPARAIGLVLAGKMIHIEANKSGMNPAIGPVKLI